MTKGGEVAFCQGCANGGVGASRPQYFQIARKLVKSQPCCKSRLTERAIPQSIEHEKR